VRHGIVPGAPKVALVSEQGTKIGRQSFIHIELTYGGQETSSGSDEIPSKIEVGGSVRPVISGTLLDFD
jgi:predicted PhzF superfamily epimerase YddE/YHI9